MITVIRLALMFNKKHKHPFSGGGNLYVWFVGSL